MTDDLKAHHARRGVDLDAADLDTVAPAVSPR
jgi:hypothetical protein